jgi:septal ring factor EnvC (AmiA/AmiB activator)
MSEINNIKSRFAIIEQKISRHEYNKKELEDDLKDITKQIHKAVDTASKEQRKELDDLLMFINYIKTKFGFKWFLK